jgi:hypothetical protein
MDARHRRRIVSLLAITLATAATLAGPAGDAGLLPPVRQALRVATSLVSAPPAPLAARPSATAGIRA